MALDHGRNLFNTYSYPSPNRQKGDFLKSGFEWSERWKGARSSGTETESLAASWQLPESHHHPLDLRSAATHRTACPQSHTVPMSPPSRTLWGSSYLLHGHCQWLSTPQPPQMVRNVITYYKPTHLQLSSGTGQLCGSKRKSESTELTDTSTYQQEKWTAQLMMEVQQAFPC